MPSNPSSVVLQFHRHRVIVRNSSPSWIYRVQDYNLDIQGGGEAVYELGNVDPVGRDFDLIIPRVTITRNMVDAQLEKAFANKTAAPVTLADILSYTSASIFRLVAPEGGAWPPTSFLREEAVLDAVVTSIRYEFEANRVLQETFECRGRRLFARKGNFVHDWGSFASGPPGAIRGRDAILRIGTNTPTDTYYRVQRFTISVDYRSDDIYELGNRALAGVAREPARITLDLEVAEADNQPDEALFQTGPEIIDLQNPAQSVTMYLLVMNPDVVRPAFGQPETPGNVLKAFKISGACAYNGTIRSQVRGVATRRYTLTVVSGSGDGGLTIYEGAPPGMTG